MLECCDHSDAKVSQTAIEAINSLTLLYDKLVTKCGKVGWFVCLPVGPSLNLSFLKLSAIDCEYDHHYE
jgi:hypothetical protein